MNKLYNRLLPAFFLILFTAAGIPIAAEEPRLTPLDWAASYGANSTALTIKELIFTSFKASGADERELKRGTEEITQAIAELKKQTTDIPPSYDLGKHVLSFMHEKFLGRYVEKQTKMHVLLQTGRYNCVSSAVLYMILGKSVDLKVGGISTPSHAFCYVDLKDRHIDVETTNTYGFDPGSKQKFQDSFGNTTGYSYVPPSAYSKRTKLNPKQVVSLILHNRIADLEHISRYAEAVGIAVDKHSFLNSEASKDNLIRVLLNYGSYLNKRNRYAQGLEWVDTIREKFGDSPQYDEYIQKTVNNHVVTLMNNGDYNKAGNILDLRYEKDDIGSRMYRNLRTAIAEKQVQEKINRENYDEAIQFLSEMKEKENITEDKWLQYMVYIRTKQAKDIAESDNYLKAADFLEQAIMELGKENQLVRTKKAYEHNYAVSIHNRMAQLARTGNYEEAIELVKEGLKQDPDSKILNNDLKRLNAATSQ